MRNLENTLGDTYWNDWMPFIGSLKMDAGIKYCGFLWVLQKVEGNIDVLSQKLPPETKQTNNNIFKKTKF